MIFKKMKKKSKYGIIILILASLAIGIGISFLVAEMINNDRYLPEDKANQLIYDTWISVSPRTNGISGSTNIEGLTNYIDPPNTFIYTDGVGINQFLNLDYFNQIGFKKGDIVYIKKASYYGSIPLVDGFIIAYPDINEDYIIGIDAEYFSDNALQTAYFSRMLII